MTAAGLLLLAISWVAYQVQDGVFNPTALRVVRTVFGVGFWLGLLLVFLGVLCFAWRVMP